MSAFELFLFLKKDDIKLAILTCTIPWLSSHLTILLNPLPTDVIKAVEGELPHALPHACCHQCNRRAQTPPALLLPTPSTHLNRHLPPVPPWLRSPSSLTAHQQPLASEAAHCPASCLCPQLHLILSVRPDLTWAVSTLIPPVLGHI